MSAERNTEIWSTRLQRELLALTTENGPEDTKDEVAGVLPPFVSVKNHGLDITKGDCTVSFLVDIPKKPSGGTADDKAKEPEGGTAGEGEEVKIVVTLDASLRKKDNGSVDQMAVAYPFLKPVAVLSSGSKLFPEGSTIKDGDQIDVEIDWTPSLHLTDAILNIGLKIKESILQNEPFHAAKSNERSDPVEEMVNKAKKFGSTFRKGLAGLTEKSGETPEGKEKGQRKPGLRLGRKKKKDDKKKLNKPNPAEIRIGDEINMLEAPWVDCQGVYSCKAIRRPAFVDDAIAVAAQSAEENQVRSMLDDDDKVPDNLGDYMRLQAGSIGQVCVIYVWPTCYRILFLTHLLSPI